MKFQLNLVLFFVFGLVSGVSSQIVDTLEPPAKSVSRMYVNNRKEKFSNTTKPALIDPKAVSSGKKWNIILSQHGIDHGSKLPASRLDSIKHAGDLLKREQNPFIQSKEDDVLSRDGMTVTPTMNVNFKGNTYNGWAPPDNNLAVSDAGYIVSVINTSLLFTDVNGNVLLEENFDDFLSFLQLTGVFFDPKVLYDPVEDKFIMVLLNGNTPETSTVVIGFSTSGNPNETWWFYTLTGNPTGGDLWLDYPSIGISLDDLYISGNLFTSDGNFDQVFIYQIEKSAGFQGEYLNGVNWYDVRNAHGMPDFTVVPVSFGFDGSVSPGIFLVSVDSDGGTEAMLYYTDGNSSGNPNLYVFSAPIPKYYIPFDGVMKGTTDKIKTNDCRILTAFYADETVHFAFNTRGDDLHTKIQYCRLNTSDLTQVTLIFGQTPFEYAYPSIAPFSTSVSDKTVLIGFLRSSGSIFPEFRVGVCDHDMNFSGSLLVKEGESYTNFLYNENRERWGDYTGMSRRHTSGGLEVWVSGCYGEDFDNGEANILSTWIAQITNGQTGAAPVANFSADKTSIFVGQNVTFTSLSANSPTSWSWSFPGGTPLTSNLQNPTVTYQEPGLYDVILTVSNAFGSDEEMKSLYISVSESTEVPVAEFTSDVTSIAAGEAVRFEDLSVNTPTAWQWFFPGGAPGISYLQNPIVSYPEQGCFDVTLIATNAAGNHAITKPCYIDVLTTGVGDEASVFNRFVLFPNPVSDGRLSVEFAMAQATELNFFVVDHRGMVVKHLLHRRVKEGLSNLSFNTEFLIPGIYSVTIQDAHHTIVKSEQFIVGG